MLLLSFDVIINEYMQRRNDQCKLILRKLLEGKEEVYQDRKGIGKTAERTGEQTPSTARKVRTRQEEILQTVRMSREDKTTVATHNTHNTEQSEEQPNNGQKLMLQIDAIFTQLEDLLIQAKQSFQRKVVTQLTRPTPEPIRSQKATQQIELMTNLLDYFQTVSRQFHPSPPSSRFHLFYY